MAGPEREIKKKKKINRRTFLIFPFVKNAVRVVSCRVYFIASLIDSNKTRNNFEQNEKLEKRTRIGDDGDEIFAIFIFVVIFRL